MIRPYPDLHRVAAGGAGNAGPCAQCRDAVRRRFGLPPDARIVVGIERFDYTKGILDRMKAIDELSSAAVLEGPARLHPGRRADAQQARHLQRPAERGRKAGEEINARHGGGTNKPIVLASAITSPMRSSSCSGRLTRA